MSDCPSEFQLLRFMARDLSGEIMQSMERHVSNCLACQKQMQGLEDEMTPFDPHAENHVARVRGKIQVEMGATPLSSKRHTHRLKIVGIAVAASVVLVLGWMVMTPRTQKEKYAQFRSTGTAALEVVGKRQGQVFKVTDNETLVEGDALRFLVNVERPGWVSIFSIDSRGIVTPIYPDTAPSKDAEPLKLGSAGRHTMSDSFVLDDALGREWFVLLYSEKPFDRHQLHHDAYLFLTNQQKIFASKENVKLYTLTIDKAR